jgi:hypothetical protein
MVGFLGFLSESGIPSEQIFRDSRIQPNQRIYHGEPARDLGALLGSLGLDERYAAIFSETDDEVFGEKFFVYTTFSESQADLNPTTNAGFRLVVDDLFQLLSDGRLAMMRMDAIKYLWKEIGKQNFDMEEGNHLIEVIRLAMRLAAPRVQPLDEINSPDAVVYEMGKEGGFAYLFGQVNAVPIAFNEGSLEPLRRMRSLMKERCPQDLVLFVMLSTHDGRSVQGIGVQRTDGHVSISEFYRLKKIVEDRGGKPKYRSVPKGEVPADTLTKVCDEACIEESSLEELFEEDDGGVRRLRKRTVSKDDLVEDIARVSGRQANDLGRIPAIDYLLEWLLEGQTAYELCCTSREAFSQFGPDGRPLSAEAEARRLALAQLYVFTMGQVVPAIYFNDLLGLENDLEGFERTGQTRDLLRRKSSLATSGLKTADDPFRKEYLPLINRVIDVRCADGAFYPGSSAFEFRTLGPTVFLNHPYHDGDHSLIVGNIAGEPAEVVLSLADLAGSASSAADPSGFEDLLTGEKISPDEKGVVRQKLGGYGALWLKSLRA